MVMMNICFGFMMKVYAKRIKLTGKSKTNKRNICTDICRKYRRKIYFSVLKVGFHITDFVAIAQKASELFLSACAES